MTYSLFQVVKNDFQEGELGAKDHHSKFRLHIQNIFMFNYLHVSLLWSSKQNIRYHSLWLRKKKRIPHFRWFVYEKWYIKGSSVYLKQKTWTCFLNYTCSRKNELILSQVCCRDSGLNNCLKLTNIHHTFEIFSQNLSFPIFQKYKSEVSRPTVFQTSLLIWERRP